MSFLLFFGRGGTAPTEVLQPPSARIELFASGSWVSLGRDVLYPIRCVRGNPGNSPVDTIATAGTMDFALRNDTGNTAGVQGYYSPNNSNVRTGFDYGAQVRLVLTSNGTDYVRWVGRLRSINPIPGVNGRLQTLCLAHDCMADLAETDIREVTRQLNQTESVLLTAVLNAMPAASQPLARSIDSGIDTFPVAFDDLGDGVMALNLCERIVTSAQGRLFPNGDGTLRYLNRVSVALNASAHTFTESEMVAVDVPSDLSNVYNRVRVVTHPKEFSASTIVLATHVGSLALEAGATQELWLTYQDPDRPELKIGGSDTIAPVASTDYAFNAAEDGSGADVTASMTVTAEAFASTVKFTITNASGATAYKQLLQLRGTGIYDLSPVPVEVFEAMSYGNRALEIDTPYQDDQVAAHVMAEFIQGNYKNLANHVNSIEFWGNASNALLCEVLERELGDVVTLSESVTLPTAISAYVQSIEYTIEAGDLIRCRFGLAPRITQDVAEADGIQFSDSPAMDSPAPETRIDVALTDWSEIAA